MPALEKAAEDVLRERGCERDVSVALGQEDYPTRDYEGFCFPAGEYLSLRVMIGKAEGRNWWCVLFPSLCLSVADGGSAEQLEEAFVAVGLTPEQYRVITESDENTTYRLRFKVLEILEAWRRGER
jgi:stage II sporulation protein R